VKFLSGLAAYALFYPTLLWNRLHWRVGRWRQWDRIDDCVVLSGLPTAADVPAMLEEGVRGVINTCRETEGPVDAYREAGIEQLWLPTIDFTPPTVEDIERAVKFIQKHADKNESVLVHCKAGRGRSATMAICWLIARTGLSPSAALAQIQSHRPHVLQQLDRRHVVQEFYKRRGDDQL